MRQTHFPCFALAILFIVIVFHPSHVSAESFIVPLFGNKAATVLIQECRFEFLAFENTPRNLTYQKRPFDVTASLTKTLGNWSVKGEYSRKYTPSGNYRTAVSARLETELVPNFFASFRLEKNENFLSRRNTLFYRGKNMYALFAVEKNGQMEEREMHVRYQFDDIGIFASHHSLEQGGYETALFRIGGSLVYENILLEANVQQEGDSKNENRHTIEAGIRMELTESASLRFEVTKDEQQKDAYITLRVKL